MAEKLPKDPFGEDLLTCSICYDRFKAPKVLPCLHSFCQDCITRHYSIYKLRNRGQLSCPTCREIIPLPDNGISGFKEDGVVLKVKEILKKLPAITEDLKHVALQDAKGLRSDSSDSGHGSMVRLSNIVSSMGSRVGSIILGPDSGSMEEDGSSSDDETPSRRVEYTKPQRHPLEVEQEQMLLSEAACLAPSVQPEAKRCRTVENPETARKRKELRKAEDDMQNALSRLRMKVLLLYRIENHIKLSIEYEALAKLNQKASGSEKHSLSAKQKRKLHKSSAEKHGPTLALLITEQDKAYKQIIEVKSLHDVLEEVLEKVSSSQLDAMHGYLMNLMKKTQSLTSKVLAGDKENPLKGVPLPQDLINMVKNEMSSCNDTSLMPAPTNRDPRQIGIQFLFKISGYGQDPGRFDFPTHATFMPNGDILVADKNNFRLQIFNSLGQFKHELLKGWIKPRRARVNPHNGLIYISDEQAETVKVLSQDGEILNRIGESYFQCPSGLDFDSKGNLVMTDPEKGYVTIHDYKTGKTLLRFIFRYMDDKKMPNPYYVAVNHEEDQIVISDNRNNKVKVFSTTGQLLFKIPKVDCPRGVCVDPFGNILIAEGDKHRVSMYNPYGKFVQNLIETEEFGLRYPLSLDMDKEGRLLVTQCGYCSRHEVLVFQMG